jgi:hypothetical protein
MREEIVWAMNALDRHVRGGRSPFAKDGPWTSIVQRLDLAEQTVNDLAAYAMSEEDAAEVERGRQRRAPLRTHEVDRMNRTLGWVEHALPAAGGQRQLVAVVAIIAGRDGPHISWLDVMGRLRLKGAPDAVRMRHSRAITAICRHANREFR